MPFEPGGGLGTGRLAAQAVGGARYALEITVQGEPQPAYGVAAVQADTALNDTTNTVLLTNIQAAVRFPGMADDQAAPLKAWAGNAANVPAAQKAFLHRARMNGAARSGKWSESLEKAS